MEQAVVTDIGSAIGTATVDNVIDVYNKIAENYDEWHHHLNIDDAERIAKRLSSLGVPKDAPIIDFGAGTGLAARLLSKEGFTNMVALDGSAGMLDIAKKEGLYKEYFEVFLGIGKFPEELKGRFQVSICVGLFLANHAQANTLEEMISSMRGEEGDILLFIIREDAYIEHKFKDYFDSVEAQGQIKLVHTETFERYKTEEFKDVSFFKPSLGYLLHYVHTGKK